MDASKDIVLTPEGKEKLEAELKWREGEERERITEAIKVSSKRTNGWKGVMFGADILIILIIGAAYLVLGLLSAIPYIGVLFTLVLILFSIAVSMLIALYYGLVQAAFYEEITNSNGAPTKSKTFCPNCGTPVRGDSRFCPGCGQQLQ